MKMDLLTQSVELCDKYSFDYISENYSMPEFSKIKMALLFSNVESEIIKNPLFRLR